MIDCLIDCLIAAGAKGDGLQVLRRDAGFTFLELHTALRCEVV